MNPTPPRPRATDLCESRHKMNEHNRQREVPPSSNPKFVAIIFLVALTAVVLRGEAGSQTETSNSGQNRPARVLENKDHHEVEDVVFSPNGKWLAAGYLGGYVRLWRVPTWHQERNLDYPGTIGDPDDFSGEAFSKDGSRFASAKSNGEVKIWNVTSWKVIHSIVVYNPSSVAFSPDLRFVASQGWASSDFEKVFVRSVATGRLIRTLQVDARGIHVASFSPDGRLLATLTGTHKLILWEAATGRQVLTLDGHTSGVRAVAFSPDGRLLASASEDHTANVWEVATGQLVRTFQGQSAPVYAVAFSPSGRILASGTEDDAVKLWDVATGREILSLSCPVSAVAFSPDGRWLAVGGDEGTLTVWDLGSEFDR